MLLPWAQISGAVAGGLVGGFSGFVANSFTEWRGQLRMRRNVAAALVGEIEGLCEQIRNSYLGRLVGSDDQPGTISNIPVYQLFRGERDYIPIYRSMGVHTGLLPSPLPRKLVKWYTGLAVCLERAHELHELARQRDPDWVESSTHLWDYQRTGFADLLSQADDLLGDLTHL